MAFSQKVLGKYYEDNFNRANGSPGAEYVTVSFSGQSGVVPVISSNQLRAGTTTTNNVNTQVLTVNTAMPLVTDDCVVRAKVVSNPNGLYAGLCGRCDSTGWVAACVFNNGATGIQTLRNGTGDAVRASVTGNFFAANDIIELEIVGNIFRCNRIRSGTKTAIVTWTDSGNAYPGDPSRRLPGVVTNSDRNFFGTQNWGTNLDDFQVWDYYTPPI